jgi:hypothetical protein
MRVAWFLFLLMAGCGGRPDATIEALEYARASGAAMLAFTALQPGPPPPPAPTPPEPEPLPPVPGMCANCNGTGTLGDGRIKIPCRVCNGTGRITEPRLATSAVAWLTSPRKAQAEAAGAGLPILMHWWGEGCAPCERMDQVVFTDEAVCELLTDELVPLRVNVAMFTRETRQAWGAERVPTDFVITSDWRHKRMLRRTQDPRDYERQLRSAIEWARGQAKKNKAASAAEATKQSRWSQPVYRTAPTPFYTPPVYYTPSIYMGSGCGGGGCSTCW